MRGEKENKSPANAENKVKPAAKRHAKAKGAPKKRATAKAKAKAKGKKAAKAKAAPKAKETKPRKEMTPDEKQLVSRKSSAYHVAKRKALSEGLDSEAAAAAARAVSRLQSRTCMHI